MPDQPAEGGEYAAPADMTTSVDEAPPDLTNVVDLTTDVDEAFAEAADRIGVEAPADISGAGDSTLSEMPTRAEETPTDSTLAPEDVVSGVGASRYQGEGVYVGSEPPEGFTIKGNERSMKYHVPESAGYSRTVAEVWFNSEDAAQQAGFVRAQR